FGEGSWPLVTAGLRLTFAPADGFRGSDTDRDGAPAADLAAAILASFPPAAFDGIGRLRPPAVGRAARVVREGTPVRRRRDSAHRPPAPFVMPAPVEPPTADPLVESPRPPHAISFSSLRKRRPAE
ncbi:MAG TPA: hypothetical protein VF170_13205, partial [Planctomycetaceae bacterium]